MHASIAPQSLENSIAQALAADHAATCICWSTASMCARRDCRRSFPENISSRLQAFKADVLLAENLYPCSALLAHKLELPWVNYWAPAPLDPDLTSLWSGANRRLFQPNPLSYLPQSWMRTTTQHMVRTCAHLVACSLAAKQESQQGQRLEHCEVDRLAVVCAQALMVSGAGPFAWPAST